MTQRVFIGEQTLQEMMELLICTVFEVEQSSETD
jgi:hypothetical protein